MVLLLTYSQPKCFEIYIFPFYFPLHFILHKMLNSCPYLLTSFNCSLFVSALCSTFYLGLHTASIKDLLQSHSSWLTHIDLVIELPHWMHYVSGHPKIKNSWAISFLCCHLFCFLYFYSQKGGETLINVHM